MSKKLYVGNLPFTVNDSALQELFAQVGTVESAKVITDRDSGRSKGFGFVEMASDQEAADAISKLNETQFQDRTIKVSEAKPQAPRDNRGGGFGGGRSGGGRGRGGFGGGRDRY